MTDDEILAAADRVRERQRLERMLRMAINPVLTGAYMEIQAGGNLFPLTMEDSHDIALFLADRYGIELKRWIQS